MTCLRRFFSAVTYYVQRLSHRRLALAIALLATCGLGQRHSAVAWQQSVLNAVVASASNEADAFAPGSAATAYGENLAPNVVVAAAPQASLDGTFVNVGQTPALLTFVSPTQINFLIPDTVAPGLTTVEIISRGNRRATRQIQVSAAAPALFTFNGTGSGVVAGLALRITANGEQRYDAIAQFDNTLGQYRTRPIDLSNTNERVFLVFYLSGIAAAAARSGSNAIKINVSDTELTPLFAGASGYPGVDQVNVELPQALNGRGVLKLAVTVAETNRPLRTSNQAEIEIGGDAVTPLSVTGYPAQDVLAGQTIEITGGGLPTANAQVLFTQDAGTTADSATASKLTLRVPFGSETGPISIKIGEEVKWRSPSPLSLRTSVSGYVRDTVTRQGVAGYTISLRGTGIIATTNADGAYVLPDAIPRQRQYIDFIQPPGSFYPAFSQSLPVIARRDNQMRKLEVQTSAQSANLAASAKRAAAADTITLDPPCTGNCPVLARFVGGRTPLDLPAGYYSQNIAQLTPFGQKLTTPAKLKFQNVDKVPVGTPVRVFKFDQTTDSPTFGQFVDIGSATFTDNGNTLETASGAITEGSYYFVSPQWPTATIIGHVVESDGVRPARRALVSARGQSTFTDGNGGFVLRNVPVISAGGINDSVTLEVSFHRPDGTVASAPDQSVALNANQQKRLDKDIVLAPRPIVTGPAIIAPAAVNIAQGQAANFAFLVTGLSANQQPSLSNAPAFASLCQAGSAGCTVNPPNQIGPDVFVLRLSAQAQSGQLTIAAGNERHTLAVTVVPSSGANAPIALAQGFSGTEDTPMDLTLASSNAGAAPSYVIAQPLHGSVVCLPAATAPPCASPSVRYLPAENYYGTDSLTFSVRNGSGESAKATVSFALKPVNDPPIVQAERSLRAEVGQEAKLILTVIDPDDGQTLTDSFLNVPPDAVHERLKKISPTNWQAKLTWTPTILNAGKRQIRYDVQDGVTTTSLDISLEVTGQWAQVSGIEGGTISALLLKGNTVFAGTVNGGLYRSFDLGVNWFPANAGLAGQNLRALVEHRGQLYAGTDDGIYRSNNDGQTWQSVSVGLDQFAGRYVPVTALLSTGDSLFTSTLGGGVYRFNDVSPQWTPANQGITFSGIRCLLQVGGTLYAGTGDGDLPGAGAGIFRSVDNGASWRQIGNSLGTRQITALLADASGKVYAATNEGCFVSADGGASWNGFNTGLPTVFGGRTVEIASLMLDNGVLLAGTYGISVTAGQGVFRYNTATSRWESFGNGITNKAVLTLTGNASALFAGTYGGGVFRSLTRGQSWEARNRGLASATVDSLAVKQSATGALYFAGAYNVGVFRSDNRGQSWTRTHSETSPLINVRDLAVNGNALFAVTEANGVFRSLDNGGSWTPVNSGLPTAGVGGRPFLLATVLVDNGVLYAGGDNGVYVSTNNGDSWTPRTTGLAGVTVESLAVRGQTIYAGTGGVDNSGYGGKGIFRSSNGGASWTPYNVSLPPLKPGASDYKTVRALLFFGNKLFAGTDRNEGGTFFQLDNPDNPSTPWVQINSRISQFFFDISALASDGSKFFVGSNFGGAFLSTDGGASFLEVNGGLPPSTSALALTFDGDALVTGTFGSIAILKDGKDIWQSFSSNLSNRFINNVFLSGNDLLAGTLGDGVFRLPNRAGDWVRAADGLPAGTNVQALTGNGVYLFAATFGDGVYRADNQAKRWENFANVLRGQRVNTVFVQGTTLWAGTDTGVFRSTDNAVSWTAVSTGLGTQSAFSLALKGTTLFAGTQSGVFQLATDGVTWQNVSGTLLNGRLVRALAVNNGSLWAGTQGGGLYRLDDGNPWREVNNGLPAGLDVQNLAAGGTRMYAGTVFGVFYTENNGERWQQLNAGLSDIYIATLALRGDSLFAGTRLRGVFKQQVPDTLACPLTISSQPASKTIKEGQTVTLSVAAQASAGSLQYQWYRGVSGNDAQPVVGATNATFATPALQATTSFWVRVKTQCNSFDSATATVLVNPEPRADLELSQTISAAQVAPGGQLTYTLTVRNKGPNEAVSVAVTGDLPTGLTGVQCTATDNNGAPAGCFAANGQYVANFISLPKDGIGVVTLRGTVTAAAGGSLSSSASARALAADANPTDNLVRSTVQVANDAPTLTALNPATALAGGPAFTLTVTGANFVNGAVVRWNGVNRTTTFVGSTQLSAQIPAEDIRNVGVANVAVSNPGGVTSNVLPLTISKPCTYSVDKTLISFGAQGGSDKLTVSADSGCGWTVDSPVEWLVIDSPPSGVGQSIINFTVKPNPNVTGRIASLLVAGQYVLFTQSGSAGNCTPRALAIPQFINDAISNTDCRYLTASTTYSDFYSFSGQAGQRIALELASSGSDPYLRLYAPSGVLIAGNRLQEMRVPLDGGHVILPLSGSYLIEVGLFSANATANYTLNLTTTTDGANCTYSVNPELISLGANAATGNLNVSTSAGCAWTAVSSDGWINFSNGSGAGTGSVGFSVPANPFPYGRVGAILVAGKQILVHQQANTASCAITPLNFSQPVNGSLSTDDCPALFWPADKADQYSFVGQRGQRVALTMAGANFSSLLSLTAPDRSRSAISGGSNTSRIPPGSEYFVLPQTGTYLVEATSLNGGNTGNYTLTLAALTGGTVCSLSVAPGSRNVAATAGTGTFNVTGAGGCAWAAESTVPWISITGGSNGFGSGVVNFSVDANSGPQRSGVLLIAGQSVTVTQEAGGGLPPTVSSLSPNSAAAGSGAFTLTVNGANFVAASKVLWNGIERPTAFVSATQLTAQISAADLAAQGTAQVAVTTPGVGASGNLPFTITPPPLPPPVLSALTPNSANVGSAAFVLTVTGANFVNGAIVYWNGTARATSFTSATQLLAQISAADLAVAGVANVTVGNPNGALSNALPFTINRSCSYSVSATMQTFSASGGTGSIAVTASNGCSWTAAQPYNWLTINSGASGVGNGAVSFTVSPNTTASSRVTSLLIAGQSVLMFQPGNTGNCPVTPLSLSQSVGASLTTGSCRSASDTEPNYYAGFYSFTAQAGQRVSINMTSTAFDAYLVLFGPSGQFMTFDNDGGGGNNARIPAGSGELILPLSGTYLIEASSNAQNQTGNYSLSLTGSSNGACSYALSPGMRSFSATGGTGSITVTAPVNCVWAVEGASSWLTLSNTSGVGNGTINYTVAQNTTAATRAIDLLIGGQYASIAQAGNTATGLVTQLNVPQTVSGSLSANDWRAIGFESGFADFYTFNGQAGQRIVLTMNASSFNVFLLLFTPDGYPLVGGNATSARIPASGEALILPVTGTYLIQASSFNANVTGNYTLSLETVSTQTSCAATISPGNRQHLAAGGAGTVSVNLPTGCAWTAASAVPWLTINAGASGNGSGTVSYTVSPNSGSVRTGNLLIAGQNFTVTQDALTVQAPTLSGLSPASVTAGSPGFTLTLTGTNFASNSVVRWNGADRVSTVVSATQMTAQISAGDVSASGTASVTVVTPGVGVSNPLSLVINPVQTNRVLRAASVTGTRGGTVSVPLELLSQGNENGLSFSLLFDPTVLSNPQLTLGSAVSVANFNVSLTQATSGRVGAVLALPSGQVFSAGTRQIVVATFNVAANASVSTTGIGFGDQPIARELSDANANTLAASYQPGTITLIQGLEADVAPRPNGDGRVTVSDWVQLGRFSSGLDIPSASEFARVDCAPRETRGNGVITISDLVQAGRYAAGLDEPVPVGGPSAPGAFAPGNVVRQSQLSWAESWLRRVQLAPPVFGAGQTVSVAVELLALGNENALSFSLQFDPRQWRYVSAAAGPDAAGAILSINDKHAALGRLGLAVALPPGRVWEVGLRSFVVVNFVATEGGGASLPIQGLGDWPALREVVSVAAEALDADWPALETRLLTNVSPFSFLPEAMSPGALVAGFGQRLSATTDAVGQAPWPLELAGTSVFLTDSLGRQHRAELLFVSPTQVNYRIPIEAAPGPAEVKILTATGAISIGRLEILY